MAHRTLGIALVERACLPMTQPLMHDVTQHRSPRLVEVFAEIIYFLPRHRVQAGIHADTGGWLIWLVIRRCGHEWDLRRYW